MNPVRTTIFFAIFWALFSIPFFFFQPSNPFILLSGKIYFSISLAGYALILCKLNGSRLLSLLFPLLLLTGITFHTTSPHHYFLTSFCILSLIRSNNKIVRFPTRILFAELVTLTGILGFLVFIDSNLILPHALSIWYFYLIQTLYFFIVPISSKNHPSTKTHQKDSFERASFELNQIFDETGSYE